MGLTRHTVAFLAAASQGGVDFGHTLTVGRQVGINTPRSLRAAFKEGGVHVGRREALIMASVIASEGGAYCEPIIRRLGARSVDSVDASDYEGATLVHDLNTPLDHALRARFSTVIDGGSLEHVFNVPMALKNCLESVTLGGHYLAITPVNNYAVHGFYQFSPELYFRVLADHNGFSVRCMLWRSEHPLAGWYEIRDPLTVGRRVERLGATPALLYIAAKRIELCDVLSAPPQQSDYVNAWSTTAAPTTDVRAARSHTPLMRRIYGRSPPMVKGTWQWLRYGAGPTVAVVGDIRTFVREVRRLRACKGDFRRTTLQSVTFE